MERKYYFKEYDSKDWEKMGVDSYDPANKFQGILNDVKKAKVIKEYTIDSSVSKHRKYRYFDTFGGLLSKKEIATVGLLEVEGASLSTRERESDLVLTVKFPKPTSEDRDESEFQIPPGTDLYELNPENFQFWGPLKRVKNLVGNNPLQEAVRLGVVTYRFRLCQDGQQKVEVSLDSIVAEGFGGETKTFHELEIEGSTAEESNPAGTQGQDVEAVSSFFLQNYNTIKDYPFLVQSQLPKWIKALRLLRGQSI